MVSHLAALGLMQSIANNPDCWELIEMKRNGAHAVFNHVVAGTRAAGDMIMPFLKGTPASTAAA